jgi:peptide/nickel transport system substrate-binding protein
MMSGYSYVGWNEKRDKPTRFADKKVRQAMTMLIDRESIARDVFLGYATPASGPFGAASKQADPNTKPWPYDPEKAKAILTDLGYTPGADGVLVGPDGQPFRFKLTYPSKSATYDRVTLFMKDGFAKAGVVMDREPVEWPLLQKKLDERDFDAIMLGWSGSVDDDPFQMFDSSQMNDQGDNRISYSDPELDKALAAARTCIDPEKRTELWHTVHRILADDCPYTFMHNRKATVFLSRRLQNVRQSKMGLNRNMLDYNPIPWFVPKGQQVYTK